MSDQQTTTAWEVVSKRTGEVWFTTHDPNHLHDWTTRDNFIMRPAHASPAPQLIERLRGVRDWWRAPGLLAEEATAEIERLRDVVRTVVVNLERGSPPDVPAVAAWAKAQINAE